MPVGPVRQCTIMSESKPVRPGTGPQGTAGAEPPGAPARASRPGASAATPQAPQAQRSGRVVHDSRGNAVWNWVKETSRHALDTTSRILRKLEAPDLKVEDTREQELRMQDEDPGGGYDPYNQASKARKPARK